jgi:hypothetical protein
LRAAEEGRGDWRWALASGAPGDDVCDIFLWNERGRNTSGDVPGGEREGGVEERARGGSTTPESTEDDGDVCGLRLRNSVAWQRVSRRGKERRERRTWGF